MRPSGSRRIFAHGAIVLALATASVTLNTAFSAPPRFDGAGYAVLARSLLSGRGYREIDHPDAPRHAHFPPGYPLALAALWRVIGPSANAGHVFSCFCTIAAIVLAWLWFRRLYAPRVALWLGIALAVNWTWGRAGGSIQSEPLYLFLEAITRLATLWFLGPAIRSGPLSQEERETGSTHRARSRDLRHGLVLGALLGLCILTRHVAACLALAVLIELLLRKRLAAAISAALVAALLVLPWAAWLATVRQHTQIGLLPRTGLAGVVAGNALFYLRRIPDAIVGPLVEVGTVFRPALRWPATACAAFATSLILLGWSRTLRNPRRRVAALIPLATFPLLLAWPFTEAGRFLIPLVPYLLIGAVEGTSALLSRLRPIHTLAKPFPIPPSPLVGEGRGGGAESRPSVAPPPAPSLRKGPRPPFPWPTHPRPWAAALIASASIPYAAYAILSDRAGASQRSHADFDAACAWIASRGDLPGPILSRQPGEVFLLTGRRALAPPDADPESIARLIDRYGVAYLLIDEGRFARSAASPLGRFIASRPRWVRRVWSEEGTTLYAIVRPPTGPSSVGRPGSGAASPRDGAARNPGARRARPRPHAAATDALRRVAAAKPKPGGLAAALRRRAGGARPAPGRSGPPSRPTPASRARAPR